MISVIMSVYNEKVEELTLAIESIINQSYASFEFIVVLDNPTNIELLSLIKKYAKQDDRIVILINHENLGLAASLNKALSKAKYEIIARMDADDIALPKRFEIQYDYMISNDVDVTYTRFEYIDEQGEYLKTSLPAPNEPIINKKILFAKNIIPHSSVMAKKSALIGSGSYSNISVVEDYELWLRMINKGYKFVGINQPLLKVRIRDESMTTSNYYKTYKAVKFIKNFYRKWNGKEKFPYSDFDLYVQKNDSTALKYNKGAKKYYNLIQNWNGKKLTSYLQLFGIALYEPRIFSTVFETLYSNNLRQTNKR